MLALGAQPSNNAERGKWNKGLLLLRQSGATPNEIEVRAQRFRERFGEEIPLHPMVLATNWTTLGQEVTASGTHGASGRYHQAGTQGRRLSGRAARANGHGGRSGTSASTDWSAYNEQLKSDSGSHPRADVSATA